MGMVVGKLNTPVITGGNHEAKRATGNQAEPSASKI